MNDRLRRLSGPSECSLAPFAERRPCQALCLAAALLASSIGAQEPLPEEDLVTFARGVLPIAQGADSETLRVSTEQALLVIDGNPTLRLLTPKPAGADYRVTLLYELPAETRFTRFAIPDVQETPSPSQTFVRRVEVSGSNGGPDGDFEPLGEVELVLHETRGEVTEFSAANEPVRWLKLTLSGGLEVLREQTFYEFSELQGYGTQAAVPPKEGFSGQWQGRGVRIALTQDGALVSGCYDRNGEIKGTVQGRMLFASGVTLDDQARSAFILTVNDAGELSGLRSTNGAPFRAYEGAVTNDAGTACGPLEQVSLGCGDTVYGLNFAFDSAELLPESAQIMDSLYAGLKDSGAAGISIEGHTSSEGSDAYNMALSERRAQAVVDALISLGLDGASLSAQGFGESQPVASNDDEAGRMLNRRVAVRCAQP